MGIVSAIEGYVLYTELVIVRTAPYSVGLPSLVLIFVVWC